MSKVLVKDKLNVKATENSTQKTSKLSPSI